jgi:F-type H+-transporting ATPase subunit delta
VNVASENAHETGLAGRYAQAVFELARDDHAIDRVAEDFAHLKKLMAEVKELDMLIRSPLLSREDQARALEPVLDKIGAAHLTVKFMRLLAQKRRLYALSGIIAAYNRLVAKLKGEIEAEVTSARPLSHAETGELKTILKQKLGREPRLDTKVDPTLLGGLVVKVGSRMIDSSIRTKLAGIRTAMRGN